MTDDPLSYLEAEHHRPYGSRIAFQEQLAACDQALVTVGQLVQRSIVPMTEGFLSGDAAVVEREIAVDAEVDRQCAELEERCYLLIARQSPVAGDLRRLVAILRCVADVERAGDLLRHVGESLTWVHPPDMAQPLRRTIAQLGEVSADVFGGALDAWTRHDGLAATDLQVRDDEADLLQKTLLTELSSGTHPVEESVSLALIARYYERIADHGVEMARQVTYFLTGERVGTG